MPPRSVWRTVKTSFTVTRRYLAQRSFLLDLLTPAESLALFTFFAHREAKQDGPLPPTPFNARTRRCLTFAFKWQICGIKVCGGVTMPLRHWARTG